MQELYIFNLQHHDQDSNNSNAFHQCYMLYYIISIDLHYYNSFVCILYPNVEINLIVYQIYSLRKYGYRKATVSPEVHAHLHQHY